MIFLTFAFVACGESGAPVDPVLGMSNFIRAGNCAYKIDREFTGCVVSWNYSPHDGGSPFDRVFITHRSGTGEVTGPLAWDGDPHQPAQVSLGWGERVEVCGRTMKCGP